MSHARHAILFLIGSFQFNLLPCVLIHDVEPEMRSFWNSPSPHVLNQPQLLLASTLAQAFWTVLTLPSSVPMQLNPLQITVQVSLGLAD